MADNNSCGSDACEQFHPAESMKGPDTCHTGIPIGPMAPLVVVIVG
jgi:hypothetical protein